VRLEAPVGRVVTDDDVLLIAHVARLARAPAGCRLRAVGDFRAARRIRSLLSGSRRRRRFERARVAICILLESALTAG
jgi:hypothetical protein